MYIEYGTENISNKYMQISIIDSTNIYVQETSFVGTME